MYQRNDICFCHCCYQFFDNKTRQKVDVPYHEMPAEFAMELMIKRAELAQRKVRKKKHK
jgi:hypothetical protein